MSRSASLHLRPHVAVALLVLVEPLGVDAQQEADALHQPTSAYSRSSICATVAHLARDVADAERDVVGRALLAPALEELGGPVPEAQAAVGVADPERLAGDRLALGRQQLQPPVRGLGAADDRHRPVADLELDAQAGAALAVVELERAQRRLLLGDRDVARPVVAHQHEVLVEVERVVLGVGAAGAEPVEDQLREVGLEVALARGRHAARGQQRVADDQAGAEPLGLVVRRRRGSSRSARRARSRRRACRARPPRAPTSRAPRPRSARRSGRRRGRRTRTSRGSRPPWPRPRRRSPSPPARRGRRSPAPRRARRPARGPS